MLERANKYFWSFLDTYDTDEDIMSGNVNTQVYYFVYLM